MPMITTTKRPSRMFFCERAFGMFFVLWGVVLILGQATLPVRHGIFFSYLEQYMSGRCWGTLVLSIGVLRFLAHRFDSTRWRINLSLVTLILTAIVAAISIYTRLWSVTAPFAVFTTYVAFWCYRALSRDLRSGG